MRRANPENVLRAAIVSIWSPEFGARSYCVDLVSRNAFWAAIEGGLLLGTRRYSLSTTRVPSNFSFSKRYFPLLFFYVFLGAGEKMPLCNLQVEFNHFYVTITILSKKYIHFSIYPKVGDIIWNKKIIILIPKQFALQTCHKICGSLVRRALGPG